jgi:hypothetical protein
VPKPSTTEVKPSEAPKSLQASSIKASDEESSGLQMKAPVKVDKVEEIRKREVKQTRKVISSENSISERSSSSMESGSSDYDSDSDEYKTLEQLQ